LSQADVDGINRGNTRLFRHPHLSGRGDDEADFYRRYDLLFRMMPFLPEAVRSRLKAEHLPRLSDRAANAVGFAFDLANAVRRLDRETILFAEHYARQSWQQIPELLFDARLPIKAPAVRAQPSSR